MITVTVTHKKRGKKIPSAMMQLTFPPGRNETRKQPLCTNRLPRVAVTKKTKQSYSSSGKMDGEKENSYKRHG
jgi:hypothetical protein